MHFKLTNQLLFRIRLCVGTCFLTSRRGWLNDVDAAWNRVCKNLSLNYIVFVLRRSRSLSVGTYATG